MKMTARRGRVNRTEQIVAESARWVPTMASHGDVVSAVAGAPLFDNMSRPEIARALAEFDEVRFPSGRRIVLEGLRGGDFFLIVVGTVAVLVDGWRVAGLGPGDFFGEIAVLGDGLRSASVRAETPMHCLVLPNGKLEALIVGHPQLGLNLIRVVIGRYQEVNAVASPQPVSWPAPEPQRE